MNPILETVLFALGIQRITLLTSYLVYLWLIHRRKGL